LNLIGEATWRLPRWLARALPSVNIEGTIASTASDSADGRGPLAPDGQAAHGRPATEGAEV
jgi:hypothetical protein